MEQETVRCLYGFSTCSFIGQVDFCDSCDGGQNYQMEEKKDNRGGSRPGAGRPKVEKPLVTKCFRVDGDIYEKAQEIHGKSLNQKINNYLKRLAKR